MKNKNVWQFIKFFLFSTSAGIIQAGSFAIFNEVFRFEYWLGYLLALILSIVWNFTFNRRFTFHSATNVPVAMLKVFGFYLVFTPVSTWLGEVASGNGVNEYIILALTMMSNMILEYLFQKFVVFRGSEDTLVK